jgi:hypothetical protein
MRQAYVLALLGQKDDSRSVIARAAKLFPRDARVQALTNPKEFEKMMSTPAFKEMAL